MALWTSGSHRDDVIQFINISSDWQARYLCKPGSVDFRYTAFVNAANVDFTSVNAITVILAGADTSLTLEEITTGCDPNDDDSDGVANDQDACQASDLRATVVFDTCDSGVSNPRFPSGCTLTDVLAGCTSRRNPRPCISNRTQATHD